LDSPGTLRETKTIKFDFKNVEKTQELYIFNKEDDISGNVHIAVSDPIDHLGITVELVGQIIFL